MPLNVLYELKKCEDISYADPLKLKTRPPRPPPTHALAVQNFAIQYFVKEMCHHSNGNKLHKVQESAASAVGDKHQVAEG